MITIAIPKGRLFESTYNLLTKMGYDLGRIKREKRRLIFDFPEYELKIMIVKPMDVVTYVEYGAADLGIAGKDVILENMADVYEPLDLGFGYCRMVVAEPKEKPQIERVIGLKVATKYPKIAERHYGKKGIPVEIIHLYGSVELAPLTGLSHQIVDLVETGTTLKENNLVEVETIFEVTARLIVNRSSMRLNYKKITSFVNAVKRAL